MATIRVKEEQVGHAVQQYLEDRGYLLKRLELNLDHKNDTVYFIAETED